VSSNANDVIAAIMRPQPAYIVTRDHMGNIIWAAISAGIHATLSGVCTGTSLDDVWIDQAVEKVLEKTYGNSS